MKRFLKINTLLFLICSINFHAFAQSEGTYIQGRAIEKKVEIKKRDNAPLLDLREQMRKLVQRISAYARSQNPDFIVITKGSPELLVKLDDVDETKISPARSYMRSIDGIIVDGLFFGEREIGLATKPKRLEKILNFVRLAKKNRLKVFVIDYVANVQQADQAYSFNSDLELIPFVADAKGEDLNSISVYSKKPYLENPNSILSLRNARNFLYLGDSSSFGRQDEFTLKIHDTNYDIVAVNIMHGRTPLSRQAVETLKYKKIGSKRLVLAHVDLATAASYDYFWQTQWREGAPSWISGPTRDNPDRHHIQYWQPDWQNIIFGNTDSYIYGLNAQGFDGVILTGLETYKYFLGDTGDDEAE